MNRIVGLSDWLIARGDRGHPIRLSADPAIRRSARETTPRTAPYKESP